MKLDRYKGYNDDMKYKEGVLTLLEKIIELLDRDCSYDARKIKEEILEEKVVKKPRKKKGDV